MKYLYSYQEIASLVEQGQAVTFLSPLRAEVTLAKKLPNSPALQVRCVLLVGEFAIGTWTSEYDSLATVLDAFDLAEQTEVFELLEQQEGLGEGRVSDAAV